MKKIQLTVEVPDDLDSIDHLELYVNQLGQKIKREILSSLLSQIIDRHKQSELDSSACPDCKKKRSLSVGSYPRMLKTIFGQIDFTLPRRKCSHCRRTFSIIPQPLKLLKLSPNSNVTPELRKVAILCGTSWPFRQAAEVLRNLASVELSPAHIQWLCSKQAVAAKAQFKEKHDSAYWPALIETMETLVEPLVEEAKRETSEKTSHSKEQAWSAKPVYIGIDGTFINAQPRKRFFEAKVGIVFTEQRIRVSKGRNLLLNKQYVGSCQSVSEFGKRLFCCATEMGVKKETELIVLADGARWISQLAKTQYPQARLILDWWHLKKRVGETVDWLIHHGLGRKDATNWGRQLRDWLWRGKAVAALQSCRSLGQQLGLSPPADKSQTKLGQTSLQSFYLYLRNNLDSIVDYQTYRRKGYFISSVWVEKTIDLLICRRLKLRGQNWSRQGAENIVTFRQLILNDHWKSYWQQQKAS